MNEQYYEGLWDALAERDAAESKLAAIQRYCDRAAATEFLVPAWINDIKEIIDGS